MRPPLWRSLAILSQTLLALVPSLTGCFLAEILPLEESKGKAPSPAPTEAPAPTPAELQPGRLPPARLARRLAIDLSLRLPTEAEVALLEGDASAFHLLLDAHLTGAAAARALAALHRRMWHLASGSLGDLEDFIAEGDQTLAASLTEATRQLVVEEPTLLVRQVLSERRPLREVFTQPFSVVHGELLSLWGQDDDGVVWPGEPYRFLAYRDDRPSAGLLAAQGWLAAFGGRRAAHGRNRMARMLGELTCLKMDKNGAHLFYDLTADELRTDLSQLAASRSPCLSCHAHFEQTGVALAGLGDGSSFGEWATYRAPAEASVGLYGGQSFAGLADLATLIGDDPRFHRCEVEKLIGALNQRTFGTYDRRAAGLALDALYGSDLDLMAAARLIFMDQSYAVGVVGPLIKGDHLRQSSGVRILGREQWRALLEELVPEAVNALTFADALDPGMEETLSVDDMVPSGSYLYQVDRLARQAATRIVATELASGTSAQSRRLLRELPDGSGFGASQAVVQAQLKALWRRLTAEELAETSQTYLDLLALWSRSGGGASENDFRRAWRVVLVAMLTHPKFYTY